MLKSSVVCLCVLYASTTFSNFLLMWNVRYREVFNTDRIRSVIYLFITYILIVKWTRYTLTHLIRLNINLSDVYFVHFFFSCISYHIAPTVTHYLRIFVGNKAIIRCNVSAACWYATIKMLSFTHFVRSMIYWHILYIGLSIRIVFIVVFMD